MAKVSAAEAARLLNVIIPKVMTKRRRASRFSAETLASASSHCSHVFDEPNRGL